MKNLTKAILVIILAVIVFALIYQQIEINNLKSPQASPSPELTPQESPSPSSTFTPTPLATATIAPTPLLTPNPTPRSISSVSNIAISYYESNRENIGGNAKVTLNITATYISGSDITIDYSQFSLRLYVWRMIAQIPEGYVSPINSGIFTLGVSQRAYVFQLVFEFGSEGFNGMDSVGTVYDLAYNGNT